MRLIQAGDFTAHPDALRFVIATKDAGMLIADASSSKNAALFLRQIQLDTFAREHGISSPTLRTPLKRTCPRRRPNPFMSYVRDTPRRT